MLARSRTLLEDILRFSGFIERATAERTLADYESDEMLRLSVERSFEIIGEALGRLQRGDPEVVQAISEYRRIVGFRNRLAHGYDDIDNALVWEIVKTYLPTLVAEVGALLNETEN